MTSAADTLSLRFDAARSHPLRWLFFAAFATLLVACDRGPAVVRLAGDTMGTTWHVTYVAAPDAPDAGQVEAAIAAELEMINDSMSTYREDSEISRFNRLPAGETFAVSAPFAEVLAIALDVGEHSDGAYDVTVAPLVNLWGFGPGGAREAPPSDEAIAAALVETGQAALVFDPESRELSKSASRVLDFSSVAKGYAVDRVIALLASEGIVDALVEIGGEIRVAGHSPRGDAWRIAVERPDSMLQTAVEAVSVSDVGIATSGDYRNYFEVDGQRFSHMIDPRTGSPIRHDVVSVTVIDDTAAYADAWATALTVLGLERALEVAAEHDLAVYLIRREGDALVPYQTPAFDAYSVAAAEVE